MKKIRELTDLQRKKYFRIKQQECRKRKETLINNK